MKRRFRALRIAVLLTVLLGVALYAWSDVRSRAARNEWRRTLIVAVVLLEEEPVDPVAVAAFRERAVALQAQLASEEERYRATDVAPFHFEIFGPAHVSVPPPSVARDGLWELVKYTYEQRRYVHAVDEALGVDAGSYDSRIYATIRPPRSEDRAQVEGQSEQGGRLASVHVELDAAMVDLTWIVVVHELLHTLGAIDTYDASGRVLVPQGLADPGQVPLYPQARVEVMARNRPLSEREEAVPNTLSELGVGPSTARAIGW